jgi:hypothetical protein
LAVGVAIVAVGMLGTWVMAVGVASSGVELPLLPAVHAFIRVTPSGALPPPR